MIDYFNSANKNLRQLASDCLIQLFKTKYSNYFIRNFDQFVSVFLFFSFIYQNDIYNFSCIFSDKSNQFILDTNDRIEWFSLRRGENYHAIGKVLVLHKIPAKLESGKT